MQNGQSSNNVVLIRINVAKNVIYLFGGIMMDVNTSKDNFISMLHSYNLETNVWDIPKTNGVEPERSREINGVVNDETGKIYIFGGATDKLIGSQYTILYNDMNIFDTVSLTWSKGSTINAPLPRVDYTATLLSNGIIVFIGGRGEHGDVDMSQVNRHVSFIKKS